MLVRIYAALWLVFFGVAAVFALTGNFTMLAAVGFGFVAFGMVFMGMMAVLPAIVTESTHPFPVTAAAADNSTRRSASIPELLKSYGESLASANAIELQKPKHP